MARAPKSHASRFWAMVRRTATPAPGMTTPCWLWQGSLNDWGYGRFSLNGRIVRAHRTAYVLAVGPIPEGLDIRHLCHVRHCCNPAHLEPGTHLQNMRDMVDAGRSLVGEQNPAAKVSDKDANEIRQREARGEPQTQLAVEFGVTQGLVSQIAREVIRAPRAAEG